MYFLQGRLYVFTQEGVHIIGVDESPTFGVAWKFTICLVDADSQHPPPDWLMTRSPLFIVAASSPRSPHRQWVKYRADSVEFALNPPMRDELVLVLVLVVHSLLALLTIFSLSRMNLPMRFTQEIRSAISYYGINMRGLRRVLRNGGKTIEHKIEQKVWRLPIADLNSLIQLDTDYTGNVAQILVVSRCPDQPEPGTIKYLDGDVLQRTIASPAVWKKLLVRESMVYPGLY